MVISRTWPSAETRVTPAGCATSPVPLLARARPYPSAAVAVRVTPSRSAEPNEASAPARANGPGDRRGSRSSIAGSKTRPVERGAGAPPIRRRARSATPSADTSGRSATSTGRPSEIGLGLHHQGEAVRPPSARMLASGAVGVAVDDLHDVADLVGHRVDGGPGDARRIAVGVELGEHPAYLAVPVRGAESGEGRDQRDGTGVLDRGGQARADRTRCDRAAGPPRPGSRRTTGCCPRGRTSESR